MTNQAPSAVTSDHLSIDQRSIASLDGCRGLAILLVMAYHFGSVVSWGWMGVDLFFVLSGFLITRSLTRKKLDKAGVFNFLRNRFLRIAPACYLGLIFFFLLLPLFQVGADSEAYQKLQRHQLYFWSFQTDIWYAIDGWPAMVFLLPLWSLGVEAKFYLLWPLVVWGIASSPFTRRLFYLGGIILLAIVFRSYAGYWFPAFESNYRYVFFLCRLDAFAIGAMLYYLNIEGWKNIGKKIWGVLALGVFLYFLALKSTGNWGGHFSSNWISFVGFDFVAVGWASMMAYLLQSRGWASSIFESKWLGWIGRHSYGMYIFHYPIWLLIHRVSLPDYLFLPGAFFGSLAVGFLSYRIIERPFLSLKK